MTNAEKFQEIFKEFATEVWAFPEKDFLTWLNAEYKEPTIREEYDIAYIGNGAYEKHYKPKTEATEREEAIKQCEDFIKNHSDWSVEVEWANGVEFVLEDYKRLIKQEPILDKIRAEIIELRSRQNVGVLECLDILDKYKAESEDKE